MGLVVKVKRKCLMIRIRVEWSVASVVERVWCGRVVWRRNVKAVRTFRGGEVGGKTRNREGIYPRGILFSGPVSALGEGRRSVSGS